MSHASLDWAAVLRGAPDAAASLPTVDGRMDLRERQFAVAREIVRFDDVTWEGVDFSGTVFGDVRLVGVRVRNCLFQRASLVSVRMWGCVFEDCVFDGADLRSAGLSGVVEGRPNVFRRVDFSRANMNGLLIGPTIFEDCIFRGTKLRHVDFGSSVFERCAFQTTLSEVLFSGDAQPDGVEAPRNRMEGVSFEGSELRYVEFTHLDLDSVTWPRSSDHLVLEDYPEALSRALRVLEGRPGIGAEAARTYFEACRKDVGPGNHRGLIHLKDLREVAPGDLFEPVLSALKGSA